MAQNTKSEITTNTVEMLNGIPFESIIGGPLNACIQAQGQAATTTMKYIEDVGLNSKIENGTEVKEAIYVTFSYKMDGKEILLKVPLLTIVPIPYIAIDTIDIDFSCAINGMEEETYSTSSSNSSNSIKNTDERTYYWLSKRKSSKMKATISSKRSSKGTQNSEFSIESTLNVSVHARSNSMPAGMAKVLEMLTSSICIEKKES